MPLSDKPDKSVQILKKDQVVTYDGHRAVQKPKVVIFENMEHEVMESESLYISTGEQSDAPVKRGFHVRCKGGRQFILEFTDGVGWQITPLPGPVAV